MKKSRMPKKKQSKNMILYCIVIAILFALACYNARISQLQQNQNTTMRNAELQVHVIDVGQGDSILVIADGKTMLIDAAEASAAPTINDYLKKKGIGELDYAVATHMHADHIGGFPDVLEAHPAKTVLEPVCPEDLLPTSKTFENYLDAVDACGAEYRALEAGDSFSLGGAEITVLGPVDGEISDLNNTSLVLRLEYEGTVCLFTGDMETPEEKAILASGADLDADFLKVGHHGAATSSGKAFLEAVTPQYAAISCGLDNSYGHPAESAMKRLQKHTEQIYITSELGSVVFLYDKDTDSCNIITEHGADE